MPGKTRFPRLSETLVSYHQYLRENKSFRDYPDMMTGVTRLCDEMFTAREMEQDPYLGMYVGLALSQERLTVHRLDAAAITQVQESEVRTLPSEPPRLLQNGWIIESADLNKPLFRDVVCLGGHSVGASSWMMGLRFPDGCFLGEWHPHWGDTDIEGAYCEVQTLREDDLVQYRDYMLCAIEFAVTLGALLEAEGTPILETPRRIETGMPKRKPAPRNPRPLTWNVRHVRLASAPTTPLDVPTDVPEPLPMGDATREDNGASSREGLHAEKRVIRGFLRRQVCGPGGAARKWVYVASFEGTRYVGTKPLRVRVEGA